MKTTTTLSMKFLKLKRRLGLPHYIVVGVLESLWMFATNNAMDGGIGRHSNEDLAAALEWQGDPDQLIDDLVSTGWLDAHPDCRLSIHDWQDHAPNFVKAVVAKKKQPFMNPPIELPTKAVELPTQAPELPTLSSEPIVANPELPTIKSSLVKPSQVNSSQAQAVANTIALIKSCDGMTPEAELTHLYRDACKNGSRNEDFPTVLKQMAEKLRLGKITFEAIKKAILDPQRDKTEYLYGFWKRFERQAWKPKSQQEAMTDMAADPVKSPNLEYAFNGHN